METKKVVKELYSHYGTIIALYLNYVTDTTVEIVSLDEDGIIKIHRPDSKVDSIDLSTIKHGDALLDPVELFGMGYPYYIKKRGNIILLSSDEGVLVVRIKENAPKGI